MIPKFREWDKERHDTEYAEGMSYGEKKDFDMGFSIWFDHMEDLDLVNDDGSIDRVVMMSSGLKDMSGNELYEKDIVRNSYGETFIVEWLDGGFVLIESYNGGYDYCYIEDSTEYEVIGNVFEDKNLLSEEESE